MIVMYFHMLLRDRIPNFPFNFDTPPCLLFLLFFGCKLGSNNYTVIRMRETLRTWIKLLIGPKHLG